MKNGPPNIAVITPTGTSAGAAITLAKQSQIIMKAADSIAEHGIKILWSGPVNSLVKCGIIKPAKPIKPLIETAAAVIKALANSKINFVFSNSTPKCAA